MTTTAPRAGDTITTAERLDALPSLAIVIDANDEVQQRHGHLSTERGDYSAWLGVMPPTCKPSPDVALPVTVLYVPGEQPADRPSVTDQALAEAWAEGHRTGWEHCQDGNYGNDYWDDPTPNPYAAAARAETTTEQPCRHCGSCDGPPSCPDCDHADRRAETTTATTEDAARVMRDEWMQHGPEVTWLHMARALDARGLLATARTVSVHPTYTVEYQQKIADELGVEREAVLRALGLAAPLLARPLTEGGPE